MVSGDVWWKFHSAGTLLCLPRELDPIAGRTCTAFGPLCTRPDFGPCGRNSLRFACIGSVAKATEAKATKAKNTRRPSKSAEAKGTNAKAACGLIWEHAVHVGGSECV